MFYFAVSEITALNGGKPFDSMPDALDWIIETALSREMTFMPELSDENTLWFRDRYGWLQWSKVIEVKL